MEPLLVAQWFTPERHGHVAGCPGSRLTRVTMIVEHALLVAMLNNIANV
jgi:hypothetical protein